MAKYKKPLIVIAVLAVLIGLYTLIGSNNKMTAQRKISAMDTNFALTAYGKRADKSMAKAEDAIREIESVTSPIDESSVCYAINHANGEKINVSDEVAKMIMEAENIYTRSNHAYDLTTYPLLEQWGFTTGDLRVPENEEISSALDCLCMDEVDLNYNEELNEYTVAIPSYGQLSFVTCEKGCAADTAAEALKESGIESAAISLSGYFQAFGTRPDGKLWSVGITNPDDPTDYLGIIAVGEGTAATVGPYQENKAAILDPRTGYPVDNELKSVTVFCEDGTKAGCLANAMYICGTDKAIEYWRTYGDFEMILINKSNEIFCTAGMREHFSLNNDDYAVSFLE